MAVNTRKVLAVVAILVIVVIIGFLLFWFLGRKSDKSDTWSYEMIKYDSKPLSISSNGDKLPDVKRGECGQPFAFNQSATGNYIAPGGSFPWVAYFDIMNKSATIKDTLRCAGTIINERYILTAAHCMYAAEKQTIKLEKIKLGLTNTGNSTNCDASGNCAQAIFVGIEQIIPHYNYKPESKLFVNDIALIRVDQDIKFNNFIRPICLRNITEKAGSKYLVGWAKNNNDIQLVPEKHVSVLNYDDSDKCQEYFTEIQRSPIAVDSTQICASGRESEYSCIFNSGNALATFSYGRWYAEAIDSFGKKCDDPSKLGIYTEIAPFLPWIEQNIKK